MGLEDSDNEQPILARPIGACRPGHRQVVSSSDDEDVEDFVGGGEEEGRRDSGLDAGPSNRAEVEGRALRVRIREHGEMCATGPDPDWLGKFSLVGGPSLFERFFHFGEGYKIRAPEEGDAICCPPEGCIGVYLRQLEYGLRFPLNEHVAAIVGAMNVAVAYCILLL